MLLFDSFYYYLVFWFFFTNLVCQNIKKNKGKKRKGFRKTQGTKTSLSRGFRSLFSLKVYLELKKN